MTEGDAEFLYLTTTGRTSGQPREIEIWYVERAGRHYLIAEHGDAAQWVKNLRADPHVRVRVGARRYAGRARAVDGAADADLARAVRTMFDDKYQWSAGLVVELVPDA